MDIFLKAAAGVLIATVVSLILSKHGKDFSSLLIICVCAMVAGAAIKYLQTIIDFVRLLQDKGSLNGDLLSILLKAVGIGIITEIITMICADSGNAALGKVIQFLSTAVIIWLCIPLFSELLNIVESVMGSI